MKPPRGISFVPGAPGMAVPMGTLSTFQARQTPNAPAISFDGRTVTRAAFEAQANRRARALAAKGVGHNDVVVNAMPNGIEYFETSFAIWKLGATVCHVSDRLPDAELGAIVALAQPRLVVGPDPSRLPGMACQPAAERIDETLSAEALPALIAARWRITTSGGSTGRPKLIVHRQASVWDPRTATLGMIPGETILNPAPLYHNSPFGIAHIALFTGCHVVQMPRFEALELLALVERHRVSWLYMVPTMMHRVWRLPEAERRRADVSSLTFMIHMASACPVWLKEKWIEWLGPEIIWELYGASEQLGATVISGSEWLLHRGSVGRIQMGTGIKIMGEDGRDCVAGEVGEIFFRVGKELPYAYIGAAPQPGTEWQSFGDMGYLDADGYLYVVDRRTDMIVTGGENIYPAEIEAALDAHPLVASSIVIGLPDEDLVQRVHALVQVASGDKVSAVELQAFLQGRIARHKIPRSFEFTGSSLRDDAGKARRSALRAERMGIG